MDSSFFRCSSETFFFQSGHLRDASSQALLAIHHKKLPSSCAHTSGHDSSLHNELRHWLPVISFPNFVCGQLRRQNPPLQTAMDKMDTMNWLLWATDKAKSNKKGSQNVHPAPKMCTKMKKKKPQTCVAVVALIASWKATTPSSSTLAAGFSIAAAHPPLCFSVRHLQLSRRPGNLFTPVKSKPKNSSRCTCCEPCPSNMHAA